MSDSINQTEFTEKSHPQVEVVTPVASVSVPPKRNLQPLLLTLVVVLVVVVGSVTYIGLTTKRTVTPIRTPTPAPSEAPIETKGIRSEIAPYLQTIENSNPENDEHPFPPVSFDLRIKDPNSK